MNSSEKQPAIGYADFGSWYDSYRADVLDSALSVALESLEAALDESLSGRDRTRIRRITGRVKSKRRTWRKLRRYISAREVTSTDDITGAVHDLVGLRITCTNLRDIDMIQAALEGLSGPDREGTALQFDPTSERDYVLEPKESGYRGWHVHLGVQLRHETEVKPVRVELQVRTLLQDSWGELTHEDTYSKDGELPPLVEVLSKRMADLFATLDDIAEDLRSELDRIDQAAVAGPSATTDKLADLRNEQAEDAASVLADRWANIDRPIDLAALAWELQAEFGAEISDGWFGAGSFKRFVLDSLPDADISTGRQAYLLPLGTESVTTTQPGATDAVGGIPAAARALRRIDAGFPLLESGRWSDLYGQLAAAWRRAGEMDSTARSINRLTRSARDRARSAGEPISRRHLDYVAKAVLTDGQSGPLDAEAIAAEFVEQTLERMVDLRIIGERDNQQRVQVSRWLSAENRS